MSSDALRQARNWNQSRLLSCFILALLLSCLPWLTSCTAANSAFASSSDAKLSANLSSGNVGTTYNGTITVTGGQRPYLFSVSSGSLPAGLTLNSVTGTVSGTPQQPGDYSFSVQATDANGTLAKRSFEIKVRGVNVFVTVIPALAMVTSSGTLPLTAAVANTTNTAVTWTASGGTISSNGLFQAPAVTSTTTITVTATSVADPKKSARSLITITPTLAPPLAITTISLASATAGTAYSAILAATGGTIPYAWSLASGTLPSGISLQSSGTISGTTSQSGQFNFTVQAMDSSSPNKTASQTLTLSVNNPPPVTVTVSPSITTVASSGTLQFTALVSNTSNVAVTWSASRGTITSSGLYQAPSVTSTSVATVTATSVADATKSGSASVTVTAIVVPPLSITTTSLPSATGGTAYSATLAASGGTAPYSWSLASGSLPAGITLQSSGLLSGTTTQNGQFNITVQAIDSSTPNKTANQTLSLTVNGSVSNGNLVPATLFGFTSTNTSTRDYPTVNYGMQRFWDSPPLQWPSLNTASGVFDFSNLDATLATAYSSGVMEGMYTLARTPTWASSNPGDMSCHYATATSGGGGGQCDPPIDLNSDGTGANTIWKSWITAIASHANDPTYLQTHAHIRYWEIWNEPDATFYWSGSFAQLARLTEDANCIITGRGVIHESGNGAATPCTATPIDPTAQIVMSSGHATYTTLIYAQNQLYCNASPTGYQLPCPIPANAIATAVDIINFHMKPGNQTGNNCPPPAACTPETAMQMYVSSINGMLQPAELAKPLWDGEASYAEAGFTGAYTDPDMASSFIPRFYILDWSLNISGIAWYDWTYMTTLPAEVQTSYQQTYNWLSGSSLSAPCTANGTVWSCTINRSGALYLVMWDAAQSCSNGSCTTANQTAGSQWSTYQDMTTASSPISISGRIVPVGIKPVVLH